MKKIILAAAVVTLAGCSTVQKYWPRAHDPVAFQQLVSIDIAVERVDCERPDWAVAVQTTEQLAKNAAWRDDPQAANLQGLHQHAVKMSTSSNKTFCELGKKTAQQRINAVRSAWAGR
jgi:hypothetical protein